MVRRALLATVALTLLSACESSDSGQAVPVAPDAWLSGVDLAAYMDCAREQDVTLLQAHRAGDRPGAAENSIGASLASFGDGAVFSEIDVARTRDGVLVLMHDRTVDRTTTGTGTVTEMTYADIAALQLVDMDGTTLEEVAPTLDQTLNALDGVGIAQIDLKDIDMETIAAAISQADAAHRSIVITYTIEDAIALHTALPEVMMSVGIRSLDDLATLETAGVDLTRVQAWLGLGTGNPELDAALAEHGIETSYGDFRAERDGNVDYQLMADNGAEVISVDDVPAAADALDAYDAARAVLENCPAART
ncbi:glycerophosphodiester phosphodiesterase family protein [Maricaulaceae bacterium EIL42A08]|nr:glycerophosphodiester phosphodiesterase family protein [Maricaulaceae bacterium EIL42A08]